VPPRLSLNTDLILGVNAPFKSTYYFTVWSPYEEREILAQAEFRVRARVRLLGFGAPSQACPCCVRQRWAKKWMRIDSDCCIVGAFLGVLVNGNSAELNDCASF
jgi:hypothetical protein